jgi:hypothetical protein
MKSLKYAIILLALTACGGATESQQEKPLTQEEEAEIVETITTDLDEAQEALKKETDESLEEIDSLLENF